MNTEIERGGRKRLWLLLGAACSLFLINAFYPLYLTSTSSSDRMTTFSVMAVIAALAGSGKRWARIAVGTSLLIITAINTLVLLAALSDGRFSVSSIIVLVCLAFSLIGWQLLTSESVRAFEDSWRQSA